MKLNFQTDLKKYFTLLYRLCLLQLTSQRGQDCDTILLQAMQIFQTNQSGHQVSRDASRGLLRLSTVSLYVHTGILVVQLLFLPLDIQIASLRDALKPCPFNQLYHVGVAAEARSVHFMGRKLDQKKGGRLHTHTRAIQDTQSHSSVHWVSTGSTPQNTHYLHKAKMHTIISQPFHHTLYTPNTTAHITGWSSATSLWSQPHYTFVSFVPCVQFQLSQRCLTLDTMGQAGAH